MSEMSADMAEKLARMQEKAVERNRALSRAASVAYLLKKKDFLQEADVDAYIAELLAMTTEELREKRREIEEAEEGIQRMG